MRSICSYWVKPSPASPPSAEDADAAGTRSGESRMRVVAGGVTGGVRRGRAGRLGLKTLAVVSHGSMEWQWGYV